MNASQDFVLMKQLICQSVFQACKVGLKSALILRAMQQPLTGFDSLRSRTWNESCGWYFELCSGCLICDNRVIKAKTALPIIFWRWWGCCQHLRPLPDKVVYPWHVHQTCHCSLPHSPDYTAWAEGWQVFQGGQQSKDRGTQQTGFKKENIFQSFMLPSPVWALWSSCHKPPECHSKVHWNAQVCWKNKCQTPPSLEWARPQLAFTKLKCQRHFLCLSSFEDMGT